MSGLENTRAEILSIAAEIVPASDYVPGLKEKLVPLYALAGISNNSEFMSAVARARSALTAMETTVGELALAASQLIAYAERL